jgi:hypothetical protein
MAGRAKPIPDNVINIDGSTFTVVELDKANKRRITTAAKERYLVLLAEGMLPNEAAYELGLTGSRMRAEAKRDEEFGKLVDEHRLKGEPQLIDRIERVYLQRALDPDGPPQLLKDIAMVYHPRWDIFRKTTIDGELGVRALATIDPTLYTDEELAVLKALLERKPLPEIEA